MKELRVEPEAEEELEAAAAWYEAQRVGLGAEFYAAIVECLDDIRRGPDTYPLVSGAPRDLPARQTFVRRFPYKIVYFDLPTHVHVIAFAHERRRPFYWRRRG